MAGGKYNINKAGETQEEKLALWEGLYEDEDFGKIKPRSEQDIAEYNHLMERAATREDSALDAMPDDGRSAQVQSMDYFGGLARNGGRDAVADAEYARRTAQAEQMRRANTEAALQSAEARGMAGTGGGLTAAVQSAQGSASDASMAGVQAAGQMQQRRDAAAGAAGQAGYQLQGQDTSTAQAKDAWNDWYRQNTAAVQQRNVESQNQARDANTTNLNDIKSANWGLQQQNFENKMGVLGGYSGAFDSSTDRHMGAAGIRSQKKSVGEKIAGGIGDVAKIGADFIPKPG